MITELAIASTITLWYIIVIVILYRGLRSLKPMHSSNNCTFSIIIAARNEERLIRRCLDSILKQNIPTSRYEIIVVNDRSSDSTPAILLEYAGKYSNFSFKSIEETPPGISPKKYAVMEGIKLAHNEIVVFTDADCAVSPSWLATIDCYFTKDTGVVQGITAYENDEKLNNFFYGLQSIDFLSHGIVSAAAIGAGVPLNSNANNLAFRKIAFEQVSGYGDSSQKVVSGDDDLLLQRIWKSGIWKIRYMTDTDGAVKTRPTSTIHGIFEQRKRWGSKTVHYNPMQVAVLSSVFLFYITILCTIALSIVNLSFFYIFLGMLLVKLGGELLILIPGTALFNQKNLRFFIFPASLIQLPVVVFAVLFGAFGHFGWKGQKFKRKIL